MKVMFLNASLTALREPVFQLQGKNPTLHQEAAGVACDCRVVKVRLWVDIHPLLRLSIPQICLEN